jgi:hypothetical protein
MLKDLYHELIDLISNRGGVILSHRHFGDSAAIHCTLNGKEYIVIFQPTDL